MFLLPLHRKPCIDTGMQKTPITKTEAAALQRAKQILGGSEVALANALGRRQQSVNETIKRGGRIPADWCVLIEKATEGRVKSHELRPDLFSQAQEAA